MAAIIKGIKFASKFTNKNPSALYIVARNHWNKDFKPAKYPETEEERRAAAKKYNMLPEEYKPYADDGMGYGDYPKLPDIAVESKDPFYPYDFPEAKRNFGEPIHANIDFHDETRVGSPAPFRFPLRAQVLAFLGVISGMFLLRGFLEAYPFYPPVLPKQYPVGGKVHYTFEPK